VTQGKSQAIGGRRGDARRALRHRHSLGTPYPEDGRCYGSAPPAEPVAFTPETAPSNRLWVVDITYAPVTADGFAYGVRD
jgi:hypothetical protein